MKLLVIEDETDLQQSIRSYFTNGKFVVDTATTFDEADEKIHLYEYDCTLVDLNLPDGSGFELVQKIKIKNADTGIIIISARESVDDRVQGLELGADDYLVKPFHLSELNARVNSVIRRVKFSGEEFISFNEIKINPRERTVHVKENHVELTKKEYEILLFFITNQNKVLTKESIGEHLWGDYIDNANSYDFVYTHIKNLRRKLLDKNCTDYIKNIYGVGYKFSEN